MGHTIPEPLHEAIHSN